MDGTSETPHARRRSGAPIRQADAAQRYLRKQTRDGASWTLRYHCGGREHCLTLGHYPDMSLAQSRIEAREARVLLDKQQDPLTERRAGEKTVEMKIGR